MNKLSLCTNHIEKPFYIKEINKNIFSIEELGYYLYNYLYLIDDEFFGESLINYIENELEQKTIASGLYQIIEVPSIPGVNIFVLSWKGIGFCQMLFLYLLRSCCLILGSVNVILR